MLVWFLPFVFAERTVLTSPLVASRSSSASIYKDTSY